MQLGPIRPGFEVTERYWGITRDENVRDYYNAYFEAIGERLVSGIKLLDYGCGSGRFVNYLSERIADFTYWGVESDSAFGGYSLDYAKSFFGHDPRVRFGSASSEVAASALAQATVVVLSSVFTHLTFPMYEVLMGDFEPVMVRGGCVVFSCFLDQAPHEYPGGLYGPDTYAASFYTKEQLDDWQVRSAHRLTHVTSRFVDFSHEIYRAERPD